MVAQIARFGGDRSPRAGLRRRPGVTELGPMVCGRCRRILPVDVALVDPGGKQRAAHRFEDCIWRCDLCGVGYSNSRTKRARTMIWARMEDNLPAEVHAGLDEVLAHAMNKLARTTKREPWPLRPQRTL